MTPDGCHQYQGKPEWEQLTDLEYATVQVKVSDPGGAFRFAWYECDLQLTPEGQRQSSRWKTWSLPLQMSGWDIPIATAQFVGVTGIGQADGADIAQVEYTYRWNPTEFTQKFGRITDSSAKGGSAVLQRFDDGWRIQSLGSLGSIAEPQFSEVVPPGRREKRTIPKVKF